VRTAGTIGVMSAVRKDAQSGAIVIVSRIARSDGMPIGMAIAMPGVTTATQAIVIMRHGAIITAAHGIIGRIIAARTAQP
jgi:hypothetical protein